MAQVLTSVPAISRSATPHPLDRAAAAVGTLLSTLAAEWRVHRAAAEIEALDDRSLADIGLGHGQAESAARYGRSRLAPVGSTRRPEATIMPVSFTEWR